MQGNKKKRICTKKLLGNTKTVSFTKARHFGFTLMNYEDKDVLKFKETLSEKCEKYVFQSELSITNDTPHLQGYAKFNKATNPLDIGLNNKTHWFKLWSDKKGRRLNNRHIILYCTKVWTFSGIRESKGIELPDEIDCLKYKDLYEWQKNILTKIRTKADCRTICWYWSDKGCTGKSQFARYLAIMKKALIVSGKGNDIKYGISQYKKVHKSYPKIIVIDVPRSRGRKVNYVAIEEIKNGTFFSPKYESNMIVMNAPHIIIFSNEQPNEFKLSVDRWDIVEIKDNSHLIKDAKNKVKSPVEDGA